MKDADIINGYSGRHKVDKGRVRMEADPMTMSKLKRQFFVLHWFALDCWMMKNELDAYVSRVIFAIICQHDDIMDKLKSSLFVGLTKLDNVWHYWKKYKMNWNVTCIKVLWNNSKRMRFKLETIVIVTCRLNAVHTLCALMWTENCVAHDIFRSRCIVLNYTRNSRRWWYFIFQHEKQSIDCECQNSSQADFRFVSDAWNSSADDDVPHHTDISIRSHLSQSQRLMALAQQPPPCQHALRHPS